MKSTRRHELQENILAIELGKVAEFLKKRGNHLATGLLVVALIVFGYVFITRRSHARQQELQHQWDRALSGQLKPEERISALTTLAEQSDSDRIAALAGVELGYDYALQALAARNDSERKALMEKAGAWYLLTIDKFPKQELAAAKAHYGMGKLREAMRQFKQAAARYRKVKSFTSLAGYPVAQMAEVSLRQLKALQSPVQMAATAPATQPTSAPAPAPASRPAAPASRPAAPAGGGTP